MVISLPLTLLHVFAEFQSGHLLITFENLLTLRVASLSQLFSLNSALLFDMLLKIEIYRRIKNRCFVVFDDFFKFAQKFRFQINVRIIGDTCKTGVRKWTEIIATGRNGYCITL